MITITEGETYAYQALADDVGVALPTPKTEAWKYTRLRDLLGVEYKICPPSKKKAQRPPFKADVIDISNGRIIEWPKHIKGISMEEIHALEEESKHPFALMNARYLTTGLKIEITGQVMHPLLLNYHITPENENYFYHFRNIIRCRAGSSAEIIEQFTYEGEVKSSYLANIVNDIEVEKGANLRHYKYQNEAFKANHIALHKVNVEKEGKYESFCFQKGANIARNETEVFLNGEGADTKVNAVYMMNGWATLDTTTNIYHNKPYTQSSQVVKGVVGGTAKGVFQGRIHIAPKADKTSGTQLHKAILLSDEAEIDVKPELEIFADDVKCSHGAASGELDKDQLFYMRARGIGEEEARQILIDAYLDDVINQISNEQIREWFKSLR